MKHLAQIQKEFVKHAAWDEMSFDEQKDYIQQHPKTKKRITKQLEQATKKRSPEETARLKLRKRKSLLQNPAYTGVKEKHKPLKSMMRHPAYKNLIV